VLAMVAVTGAAALRPVYADQAADEIAAARPLIAGGIGAYEGGDYATAVADLTRAEKLYPANSATSLYLGLAYLKQNQLADAIAAWQRYIKLAPATAAERENGLKEKIPQYLSILRERNDRDEAEQALNHEHEIGPGDPDAVAITYFRNLGSPDLAALQKGLTALLIDDLSKVPGIKVVERERLQVLLDELKLGKSGLVSPKTAARAGRLLGAANVATGSYIDPTTGALNIDSIVAQTGPHKAARKAQRVQGQLAEFYKLEKDLAGQVLAALGHKLSTLPPKVAAEIQQPQTRSLEAFANFSHGLDERDRQHPGIARALFERALSYDPNFKLAQQELRFTPLTRFTVAQVASQTAAAAPSAAAAAAAVVAAAGAAGGGGTGTGGTGGSTGTGGSGTGTGGTETGTGGTGTGGGTSVGGGGGPPLLTNPMPVSLAPVAPPALGCPPLVCPACIAVHK
jgi:tetratricopeptide (TPR) repeat protein